MINSVVAFGLMVIELLAAELVFAHFLERRPLFYVRLVGAAVICIVAALWTEFLYAVATGRDFTYEGVSGWQDSLFKFVYYIFVFALTICAVKYCYRGDIWTVVFYCSGGYALQHIAWNISAAVGLIPSVRRVFSEFAWLPFLCEVALCAAVYCAVYFFAIRRRTAPDETKDIKGKAVLFLAVILICIGLSRMTTDNPGRDMLSALAETLGAVVNCVFILAILFDVTDRDKARSEVQIMKEMMRREKEQYRLSKENIDLINIKCHDLKHQIQALRENASEQYIKKIEDAVMFYDSVAKTGNDVLDVILTEKTLLCEQNRIKFTCVARGGRSFVHGRHGHLFAVRQRLDQRGRKRSARQGRGQAVRVFERAHGRQDTFGAHRKLLRGRNALRRRPARYHKAGYRLPRLRHEEHGLYRKAV